MKRNLFLCCVLLIGMTYATYGQSCNSNSTPSITCPNDVTVATPAGACEALVSVGTPSTTDHCFDAVTTGSLQFDGTGYVTIPHADTFDRVLSITVEAWVYMDAIVENEDIMVVGKVKGTGEQHFSLWYYTGKKSKGWKPEFSFRVTTGNNNQVKAAIWRVNEIETNRWYHLVGTVGIGTSRLIVDGVGRASVGMTQFEFPNKNTNPIVIGKGDLLGNGPFYHKGKIDEIRIWTKGIFGSPAKDYHDKLRQGDEDELMAYYRCEEIVNGTTLVDESPMNRVATLHHGVTLSPMNAPVVHTVSNTKTGMSADASATYTKGVHNETFTITNIHGQQRNCNFKVTVKAPEIALKGNGNTISNGDTSPRTADHTDFGAHQPGTLIPKNFVVHNMGNAALELTGATSSDTDNFRVSNAVATIPPGGTHIITVNYDPFTFGPVQATITLHNSDCEEENYEFDVKGEALCEGIKPTMTVVSVSCPGESNGSISISQVRGGTTPYKYSMNGGSSYGNSTSFPNLSAGTYSIRVKDKNDCLSLIEATPVGTIPDNTQPTFSHCPGNQSVNTRANACEKVVTFSTPSASDNCANSPTVSQITGPASGSQFPVGTTLIRFQADDGNGNTRICQFDVIVHDNQDPVMTCPAHMIVNNDPGTCGAVVSYGVSSSDNCSVTHARTEGLASGATFPIGTTSNTYQATDASGNVHSCTFTVTVSDSEKPIVTCPANISVSNDPGDCGAWVTYPISSSDNCLGVSHAQSDDSGLSAGDLFPIGTTTQTYTATDAAGNTQACSFTVTVSDTELPVITCPASNVIRNTDPGVCDHLAIGADLDPLITDNCQISMIVNTYNGANSLDGAVFSKGKTAVTWVATDIQGNTNTCTYHIKIRDREAPIFDNCPADTTLTIPAFTGGSYHTWAALTATDNCVSPNKLTVSGLPLSGSYFSLGTTAVSWTATDKSNNDAFCDFTVTVIEEGAVTPGGWSVQNIGSGVSSHFNWDSTSGTLVIQSGGGTIGNSADNFGGIFFPSSDAVIDFRAKVTPPGAGYYDKAGIMMRQSLDANAANICLSLSGTAVPTLSLRASSGGSPLSTAGATVNTPYWLRLYRAGATIMGYVSADGITWTTIGSYPNVLTNPLYLSLFSVTSGSTGSATFDHISINGTAVRTGTVAPRLSASLQVDAIPNPFGNQLTYRLEGVEGEAQVRLLDVTGRVITIVETLESAAVETLESNVSTAVINTAEIAAGIYFLEVRAGDERKLVKVVKK